MDDSHPTWSLSVLGDLDDVVVLVLVVAVLSLRVLPATRRWAPRGNARLARPASAAGPSRQSRHVRRTPVRR